MLESASVRSISGEAEKVLRRNGCENPLQRYVDQGIAEQGVKFGIGAAVEELVDLLGQLQPPLAHQVVLGVAAHQLPIPGVGKHAADATHHFEHLFVELLIGVVQTTDFGLSVYPLEKLIFGIVNDANSEMRRGRR